MSLWKFDHEILDIIEKGLEGNGLTFEETVKLYALDETAKESSLMRWAGQELSMRSANGKAEVHAQIGLNSTTCPRNCKTRLPSSSVHSIFAKTFGKFSFITSCSL